MGEEICVGDAFSCTQVSAVTDEHGHLKCSLAGNLLRQGIVSRGAFAAVPNLKCITINSVLGTEV